MGCTASAAAAAAPSADAPADGGRAIDQPLPLPAALLHAAIEAAPCGFIVRDESGRVVHANAAARALAPALSCDDIGLRATAEVTVMLPNGNDEEHGSAYTGVVADAQESNASTTEIHRESFVGPDGRTYNVTTMAASTRLEQLEARLRVVFDGSLAGLMMVSRSGKIMLANRMISRMFGYNNDELLRMEIEDLLPARFVNVHREHRARYFGSPAARYMGIGRDLFGKRKDGTEFPVEVGLNPVEDGAVLASIVDITERKRNETLLQARLEADVLARRSADLLATMSHEIRTPLVGVRGCLELLAMESPRPAHDDDAASPPEVGRADLQRTQLIETARRCSDTLLQIINDILTFSRLENGTEQLDISVVDMRELVRDVHDIFLPQLAAKGIAWTESIQDAVPPLVLIDAGRLQRVMLNLVANAVKFSSHSGSVTLTVRCEPRELTSVTDSSMDPSPHSSPTAALPKLRAAPPADPCWLIVDVADTGIGMPQDVVGRVFQPFAQAERHTTRTFGGTGLGLSICKRLVELMEGAISCTSAIGTGTTVTFRVAAAVPRGGGSSSSTATSAGTPPTALAGASAASAGPGPPGGGATAPASARLRPPKVNTAPPRHILVVDDDAVGAAVVVAILRRMGYTDVRIARNGHEALSTVLAEPQVDIIFMDCEMPVMDGFQATRELRRIGVTIPIVAMTANALVGDRERCLQCGMDDYLPKPVSRADLSRALARYVPGTIVRTESQGVSHSP